MNKDFLIIIVFSVLLMQSTYAQQNNPAIGEIVKIGLLVNNGTSIAAQNAAQMAIDIANKKATDKGKHFQLITKSMEGSWGTGSKEAVNMVFNERAWAILGSHNGRNAHLVEQVIAKTGLVFLSAWATDPTLTQAFVPWFFNCVPNDTQQAIALIEEIYTKRKSNDIAIIYDEGYDSKQALKSFLKQVKIADKKEPIQFSYTNPSKNSEIILNKIKKTSIDGFVIFWESNWSWNMIRQLRNKKMNQSVFGTISMLGSNELKPVVSEDYTNITIINSGNWFKSNELNFKTEYQNKYGIMPNAIAAYTFDGMNVIIEAIRSSGFDREKFQEAMSKTDYTGVTGVIKFDEKGNRLNGTTLVDITHGVPISVKK